MKQAAKGGRSIVTSPGTGEVTPAAGVPDRAWIFASPAPGEAGRQAG
jgi:hypothetical protein